MNDIAKIRDDYSRHPSRAEPDIPALCDEIERLRSERVDLLDTIKACLVAAGGSDDESLLQKQCDAAGTKPSDFIRATAGRFLEIIDEWDKSGRNGYCLPVIQCEDIWTVERILRGEKRDDTH